MTLLLHQFQAQKRWFPVGTAGCFLLAIFCSVALHAQQTETQNSPVSVKSGNAENQSIVIQTKKKDATAAASYTSRTFALEGMSYREFLLAANPLLSDNGEVSYNAQKHTVTVIDSPAVIGKVAALIEHGKQNVYNVRVTVDYIGASADDQTRLNIHDKKKPRQQPFRYENGKFVTPKNAVVVANVKRDTGTSNHSMTLLTGNGFPASLWSGTVQLDPSWLEAQTLIPDMVILIPGNQPQVITIPQFSTDFKWAEVGSKLMIAPTYHPETGNVTVEVYPRLSWIEGKTKRQQNVKIQSLSTTITVKEGQRVMIGSILDNKKNDYINLFGPEFFRSGSKFSVTDIYIKCEALKPGDPRNARLNSFPRGRMPSSTPAQK